MMTTVGMLLFSIPFVLGSVRTGFANRLVLAGVAGIGIYLVDQIISNTGLLYDINLFYVAVAPGILLIIGSRYWLNHIN
jgi:lipopolysaccharide export system permease protein